MNIMTYTATQIENAKKAYTADMVLRTVESYEPQYIGYAAAEQRCAYHNNIVNQINAGNREIANEWKYFFLNQEVKKDNKAAASKAKSQQVASIETNIVLDVPGGTFIITSFSFGNPLNKRLSFTSTTSQISSICQFQTTSVEMASFQKVFTKCLKLFLHSKASVKTLKSTP